MGNGAFGNVVGLWEAEVKWLETTLLFIFISIGKRYWNEITIKVSKDGLSVVGLDFRRATDEGDGWRVTK
jgi:hypothetical protein